MTVGDRVTVGVAVATVVTGAAGGCIITVPCGSICSGVPTAAADTCQQRYCQCAGQDVSTTRPKVPKHSFIFDMKSINQRNSYSASYTVLNVSM